MKINTKIEPYVHLFVLFVMALVIIGVGLNALLAQVALASTKIYDESRTLLADGGLIDRQYDNDRDRIQDQVIYDDQDRTLIATPEDLESLIAQTEEQFQTEAQAFDEITKRVYENQNKMRVAAIALASTTHLLGPLAPAVDRIVSAYQATIEETIQAEVSMQNRSGIKSFFFGGDDDAALALEQSLLLQEQRIEELNRLISAWQGNFAIKSILQKQIQTMRQQQVRLEQVAAAERASRGLFDYLLFWRSDTQ